MKNCTHPEIKEANHLMNKSEKENRKLKKGKFANLKLRR